MTDKMTAVARRAPSAPGSAARSVDLRDLAARYGALVVFAIVLLAFSIIKSEVFPTLDNAKAILQQTAPLVIIALGLTVVLIMGDFDLSIAAAVGLASAITVALMSQDGVNYIVAVLLGLGALVVVGSVNGWVIAGLGGSSFIVTLAAGQIMGGIELAITGGGTIFKDIPSSYSSIGSGTFLGVSTQCYIALGLFVLLFGLLYQTEAGRYMHAIGANREAARLSGIPVVRYRMIGFAITATCAGAAGLLLSSQAASHSPDAGAPYFLTSYAAVFLGAALFRPGRFNLPGTLVAAVFLEALATGLTMMSLSSAAVLIIQGVILVVAVLFSQVARSS